MRDICHCVFLPCNDVRALSRNQRFKPVADMKQFHRSPGRRLDCPDRREIAAHAWRDFKPGRAIRDQHEAGVRAACNLGVNAIGVLDKFLVLCPEPYYIEDSVLRYDRSVKPYQ